MPICRNNEKGFKKIQRLIKEQNMPTLKEEILKEIRKKIKQDLYDKFGINLELADEKILGIEIWLSQKLDQYREEIRKQVVPKEWRITEEDLEDTYDMTGKEIAQWKLDFKLGYDRCVRQVNSNFDNLK